MKLSEAIKLLKDYLKGDFVDDYKLCEAIDTVVAELGKPLPSDKELMKILYDLRDRDIAVSDAFARIKELEETK